MLKIASGSRLVMAGDSITDADRRRDEKDFAHCDWMGQGYVMMVDAILNGGIDDMRVRTDNVGISGDTSRGQLARWETDVLSKNPDWVTLMIGINDVWRHLDSPLKPEDHISEDEYRENLVKMIESTIDKVQGFVLMTPFVWETNKNDTFRVMMDRYGNICRELAEKYDVLFVDTQVAIDRVLETHSNLEFTGDRIHPGKRGHMVIARALLKVLGVEIG